MKLKLIAAGSLLAALISAPAFAADSKDMKKPGDMQKSAEPMKSDDMSKPMSKGEMSDAMKKARADWKSAKAACAEQSGAAKKSCMDEAKKSYDAAKADAKGAHKSADAGNEANPVVRSAQNDEAAKAKCAAMSGDAKIACLDEERKGRK